VAGESRKEFISRKGAKHALSAVEGDAEFREMKERKKL
jgi:hypothetical protein